MSPVPNYGRSLEELAQRSVRRLPKSQQTRVKEACRALDRVGRRDALGRVALNEASLKAAFKMHQPAAFVDGFFEKFRSRRVADASADAEVRVSDHEAEAELVRAGQPVSWIELAKSVSPYKDLPADETMEALGLTATSTNQDVRRVIKKRIPDFPDAAFQGEKTAQLIKRGMERLAKIPRRAVDDAGDVAAGDDVDAPATAEAFSWPDFFYCLKDRWLDWLVCCIMTFMFIAMITAGNLAVALTLAVIYVPFWAVVMVVGCIVWAFS